MVMPAHNPDPKRPSAATRAERRGMPLTLLLVGGKPEDQAAFKAMLAPGGGAIERAATLTDAVRQARAGAYDAILLDIDDAGGIPSVKSIAAVGEILENMPILILSERENHALALEALNAGAQDYLVRSTLENGALVRAVRFAIERKRTEQRLHALLSHDMLTQLPNRELLLDRLSQAIAAATRQRTQVALLMLDLDRFKLVNDSLGHAFGDKLLREVATRVQTCIRTSDTLARLGGDEFVVVLTNIGGAPDAAKVAAKIIAEIGRPFVIDGNEVFVSASIGISLFPSDGLDKDALITNADVAMYRAKDEGRNHFQFFTFGMNTTTVERLSLENDLHRAIEREELLLHYQPQMSCTSGEITGCEALVRWRHPALGLVPPARFIPLAEENGLIVPIGEWVLREACRQNQEWIASGRKPLTVSVNLSSRQFHQENILKTVISTLEATRLEAKYLAIEITESSLMQNPDDAAVTLCLLSNMNIGLSIDDFGTGYSSLGHLKRFPLDSLKIDRSFIQDVCENPEDEAIVRAILAMAHSMRLKVVAEGVEAQAQLDFLRGIGCDEIQGYHVSKPLPAADFAEKFLGPATARAKAK